MKFRHTVLGGIVLLGLLIAAIVLVKQRNFHDIFEASEGGEVERVAALLDSGVDVNSRDRHGRSPLQLAVGYLHFDVIELLLKRGANIESAMPNGSALVAAAMGGQTRVIRLLLQQGASVHAVTRDGWNAIQAASGSQRPDAVRLLLEAGADVTRLTPDGKTPLHLATEFGANPESVRLLIDAGADVNAATKDGMTPLMFAAQMGREESVENLLNAGAQLEAKERNGETALARAVGFNRVSVVKLLASRGADLNTRNAYGQTPLTLYATGADRHEALAALLDLGADPTLKGNAGETALQRAEFGRARQNIMLLEQAVQRWNHKTPATQPTP